MPRNIDDLSDEELRAELERRSEAAKNKATAEHDEHLKRVLAVLSMEVIDAFCPEHDRTSCSDRETINGWGSTFNGRGPRCTRCALLQSLDEGFIPFPFKLTISIK